MFGSKITQDGWQVRQHLLRGYSFMNKNIIVHVSFRRLSVNFANIQSRWHKWIIFRDGWFSCSVRVSDFIVHLIRFVQLDSVWISLDDKYFWCWRCVTLNMGMPRSEWCRRFFERESRHQVNHREELYFPNLRHDSHFVDRSNVACLVERRRVGSLVKTCFFFFFPLYDDALRSYPTVRGDSEADYDLHLRR